MRSLLLVLRSVSWQVITKLPLPDRIWVGLANVLLLFSISSVRVKLSADGSLFRASDESEVIFFSQRLRLKYLRRGIAKRLKDLERQYCLKKVSLGPGDIVIDGGANIGEVSLLLHARGAKVFSFEPDPKEFAALTANGAMKFEAYQLGLWNETGIAELYSQNSTGDSSFIPRDSGDVLDSKITTLDDWVLDNLKPGERIRLFKLDAEGGEPEVLEGARDSLARIDYISVDLGPERGQQKESTLPRVVSLLTQFDYEVHAFSPRRAIVLFRNRRAS